MSNSNITRDHKKKLSLFLYLLLTPMLLIIWLWCDPVPLIIVSFLLTLCLILLACFAQRKLTHWSCPTSRGNLPPFPNWLVVLWKSLIFKTPYNCFVTSLFDQGPIHSCNLWIIILKGKNIVEMENIIEINKYNNHPTNCLRFSLIGSCPIIILTPLGLSPDEWIKGSTVDSDFLPFSSSLMNLLVSG